MLKPGTIVRQKEVFINNMLEKENSRRLSVVLFSDTVDGENLVCTCPITSNVNNIKKNPQNYCQIPYMVFDATKLGIVRVSDLAFWKEDSVHSVRLSIALKDLSKIYSSVLNYEPSTRVDQFNLAQSYISEIDIEAQIKDELEKSIIERKGKGKVKKRFAGGGRMVYE